VDHLLPSALIIAPKIADITLPEPPPPFPFDTVFPTFFTDLALYLSVILFFVNLWPEGCSFRRSTSFFFFSRNTLDSSIFSTGAARCV